MTAPPTPTYERVAAGDIQPGDLVARTRTTEFERVHAVQHGPVAVRFLTESGRTIARPRKTAMWWREVRA